MNKKNRKLIYIIIIFGFITCILSATIDSNTVYGKAKTSSRKYKYNKKKLYLLSHLINGEARGSTRKDMLYVGSVALNRVKSKRFPKTLKKVIFAHNQYACTWDGQFKLKPTKKSIKAAKYLLRHGSQLPKKVVWQSGVPLGRIYCHTGGHYYCY